MKTKKKLKFCSDIDSFLSIIFFYMTLSYIFYFRRKLDLTINFIIILFVIQSIYVLNSYIYRINYVKYLIEHINYSKEILKRNITLLDLIDEIDKEDLKRTIRTEDIFLDSTCMDIYSWLSNKLLFKSLSKYSNIELESLSNEELAKYLDDFKNTFIDYMYENNCRYESDIYVYVCSDRVDDFISDSKCFNMESLLDLYIDFKNMYLIDFDRAFSIKEFLNIKIEDKLLDIDNKELASYIISFWLLFKYIDDEGVKIILKNMNIKEIAKQ